MFREQMLAELTAKLDEPMSHPVRVETRDSQGEEIAVAVNDSYITISIGVGLERKTAEFATAGGGDLRPMTRLALELLMRALIAEGAKVR